LLVLELGADVNQVFRESTPLIDAADRGNLAVVRCLVELAADVNQASPDGDTPVIVAASCGRLAVVRYLVQLGTLDFSADNALYMSTLSGHYSTMQYLVEEVGANMDDVNLLGETVWDQLIMYLVDADGRRRRIDRDEAETEIAALAALLRVLVLRGAPPSALVALLSPTLARVVQEGARLRARLPTYLARRRALLDAHCPALLPPLRALVHGYMELTTTEELWATGLGKAPYN
jgi:hypothetical protein